MPSSRPRPSAFRVLPLLALLLAAALPAHADGLADLRANLQKLNGQTPLKAQVTARVSTTKSEDKAAAKTETGTVSVQFEDGAQGLRIAFAPELLVKLQGEDQARAKEGSKASTPLRAALAAVEPLDLRALATPAAGLLHRLERATLQVERADAWNGQPARLLTFNLQFPAGERFVKAHTGTLEVWLDAEGRPLASRQRETVEGRAYLVISFNVVNQVESRYTVQGDRLVTVRRQTTSSGSGAGESGESDTLVTLQLQS